MMAKNHTLPQIPRPFLYSSMAVLCVTLAALGCGRQGSDPQNKVTLSNSNDQKSLPQNATPSALNAQDLEELKKFSPEDLLKEIRARELEAGVIELSDSVLERQTDEKFHQPTLRAPKRNPLLSGFSTETLVQALINQQKVVYGVDNRKEVFAISSDPQLQRSADAVVSLFDVNRVVPLEGGANSKLVRKVYGTEYRLCSNEPFLTQPCSAFCSGVLVAPDIVATAGHCVDTPAKGTPPVTDIRFVFGYRMRDPDTAELIINNGEIYSGRQTLARALTPNGADWALVKLDRPVIGHQPVRIRKSSKIQDAEDVYIIGHPCGLPAKFADGATVRRNSDADFFVANLDSYGGNSGSPVFNRTTHEVEGLLVRGEKDFAPENSSLANSRQISLVCPNTGCRGEDCVRTTIFAHLIPQN